MKNKFLKKIFSRFAFVALTIIFLFVLFVAAILFGIVFLNGVIVYYFPNLEPYISTLLNVLGWLIVVFTVLHAANRDMVPETKIPWIICIIALNVFGVAIYATFSSPRPSRKSREIHYMLQEKMALYEKRAVSKEEIRRHTGHWSAVSEALSTVNPASVLYGGTKTEYFPSGEAMLPKFLADLNGAKQYIFMEYFILEYGKFWNAILEILERNNVFRGMSKTNQLSMFD